MILHAPTDQGRQNVSQEILSCDTDEKLRDLAIFYINNFVRCFRSAKGRTPTPSDHPSRPSIDNDKNSLKHLLQQPPVDHQTAKRQALARDGFRCVVTGLCDLASYEGSEEVRAMAEDLGITATTITQAAHIFPASTSHGISGENVDSSKHDYAASAWSVMERFGQVSVHAELNGPSIHRLENIMTMDMIVHGAFDKLSLWFEETTTPHTYNLRAKYPIIIANYPPTVTFTSVHSNLPLPDSRYLRLHAACAKVANLSGAGEYIDTIFRDIKDVRVLATNGSSAELLNYALSSRIETSSVLNNNE